MSPVNEHGADFEAFRCVGNNFGASYVCLSTFKLYNLYLRTFILCMSTRIMRHYVIFCREITTTGRCASRVIRDSVRLSLLFPQIVREYVLRRKSSLKHATIDSEGGFPPRARLSISKIGINYTFARNRINYSAGARPA